MIASSWFAAHDLFSMLSYTSVYSLSRGVPTYNELCPSKSDYLQAYLGIISFCICLDAHMDKTEQVLEQSEEKRIASDIYELLAS